MLKYIPINPAKVSLPKAGKPFQSESVKALSREELGKLLAVVAGHAAGSKPVYLRDNAILQFYVATGKRRAEIINLRGDSIEIKNERFLIKVRVKGGFFLNFELDDETTKNALFAYLEATARADIFGRDEPLWLRHDKGADASKRTVRGVRRACFRGNQPTTFGRTATGR